MIPIKRPLESVVVEFDFTGELSAVTSATITVEVIGAGTDPSATSMLEGAAQISGAKVFQRVGAGIHGLDYYLQCLGVNGLDKIVRSDTLRIRRVA